LVLKSPDSKRTGRSLGSEKERKRRTSSAVKRRGEEE